jgi:hypothetical protein
MCEQCHALMTQIEALLKDNVATNKALLQMQRLRIPKYLANARQYLSSGTSLTFAYHTQAQILQRVTMIIAVVSSAGTLVIADRSWPVNGFTLIYLGEEGMLIRPEDNIVLTQASSGAMGLEFLGEEMGDRGKRW